MKRYSFARRDKKLAGVCSTFGDVFNIDPTFLRIGLVAWGLFISWEFALIAYIAGGIYLHLAKRAAIRRHDRSNGDPGSNSRVRSSRPRVARIFALRR